MMKKRICALTMATMMICSMGGSVMAGNTTDRKINFDINAKDFKKTTGDAAKQDKTAVYLHINLHSAAFQLAAQIVMKVFHTFKFSCYNRFNY